jgi:hypothetical protein
VTRGEIPSEDGISRTQRKGEKDMKRVLLTTALLVAVIATSGMAQSDRSHVTFGKLYYDGMVVRTLVPPAATPNQGIDNLYAVMGGAEGQLGVAGVGPGAPGYHGGLWAVYAVTWNTTPYLLTSEAEVLAAASKGDVTVTRVPENDVRCPVRP